MTGATGSGRGDAFNAVLALTFEDDGRERERLIDVRVVSGPMLASDTAPHAYLGRDVLRQLASAHFDYENGFFELVAKSTFGREL